MILFKKIRWKNFLSTGNVFTEMNLCNQDMTLIIGSNGAGKSTILDAVTFGLFGKPFRKVSKGQLINSITKKNCVVEVEFSIGTVNYKIIRGMKPTIFEVYQNDSLMNQSAEMKDYQEILEKQILKVNIKSFSQVVILGSATFQPFMQLPVGQRRDVIEDILDLQIFTTMNSLLKDKMLFNQEKIYELTSKKKLVQSNIDMSKEHIQEIYQNQEKLVTEKKESIESTLKNIKSLGEELDSFDSKIEQLSLTTKNGTSIKNKIEKLKSLRIQIKTKSEQFTKDNKFFEDNNDCPTCRQPITEEHKKNIVKKNNETIKELSDGLEKLADDYEKTKTQLDRILEVEAEISNLQMDKVVTKTKIKSLYEYIQKLEDEVKNISQTNNIEKGNKIAEYEKELEIVSDDYNKEMDERNLYNAASVLLRDGGIKAKIIRQYIPIINKFITKYLSSMDFFVQFELNEEFNETIKSRFRDDFSYASFSEGEKQKIDLALLFTWRAIAKLRNSVSTNLLIMDEVFDSSLDITATDYLMNIIRDLAKDSNIVIISHKEHMNEKFSNVVKFIKHKNFSSIQE